MRNVKLAKHMVEKPWGRNDIPAAFGAPVGKRIGEIWYDIAGDPLPILVKWLFTSEKLSVQVHPSDEQARQRDLPSGKEECWYIIDAVPGAVLGIGTKRKLSSDELRDASMSGEIEQLMDWKPVKAGDYFYIPAGTVHAIGAGITLVEVQQNADVTYRLYDYGRPRELHLADGIAVSRPAPYSDPRSGHTDDSTLLVKCDFFELWLIDDANALAALPNDCRRWITPVEGTHVGNCFLLQAGEVAEYYGKALVAIA
jgi:mannose-6-phosphate isomerase